MYSTFVNRTYSLRIHTQNTQSVIVVRLCKAFGLLWFKLFVPDWWRPYVRLSYFASIHLNMHIFFSTKRITRTLYLHSNYSLVLISIKSVRKMSTLCLTFLVKIIIKFSKNVYIKLEMTKWISVLYHSNV